MLLSLSGALIGLLGAGCATGPEADAGPPPPTGEPALTADDLTARVEVILGRNTWEPAAEVAGKIRFELSWPEDSPHRHRESVLFAVEPSRPGPMPVPVLLAGGPDSAPFLWRLWERVIDGAIDNPARVGKVYEVRFRIQLREAVKRLLLPGAGEIPAFRPGRHRIQGIVGAWLARWSPNYLRTRGLEARFEGGWVEFEVGPADPKAISATDLAAVIARAPADLRGYLAAQHHYLGYPLELLDPFFPPAPGTLRLADHAAAPFILALEPGERFEIHHDDPGSSHNFHCELVNAVLPAAAGSIPFRAPARAGIYRAYCDFHNREWGWFLVPFDAAR